MSSLSFGFLVLIVLVSGGIAVLADWLGRKLGKKKLTYQTRWFRLRPKKTAQVATFLSGFFVSLFTILIVSAASKEVRQWIAEGPRALEGLRLARAERQQLNEQNEALKNQTWNQRQQLSKLQETTDRQRAEFAKLQKQSESLRKQLVSFQSRLEDTRVRYAKIQKQYDLAQNRLAKIQSTLTTTQKELLAARVNLKATQENLRTSREAYAHSQKAYAMSQDQLEEAVDQYNEMTRQALAAEQRVVELTTQVKNLESEAETAQNQLDYIQQQHAKVSDELVQMTLALEKTTNDLREARLNVQRAGSAVATSRFQPLMFALGEEIARYPVPPHATVEQASQAIRTLVRVAQQKASEKGAEARGPFPAAGIFEREDPATGRIYSPEELEVQLAQAVAEKEEGLLLIAVSTLNAFKGEPVSLEVAVAENPIVYKAAEVVAEARVDGRKDETAILNQITEFVSNEIKDKARQDRMIPKRGGELSFGSIPVSELYALVGRVRASGRTVRLQAVAEHDTRAGDLLSLDFRVR